MPDAAKATKLKKPIVSSPLGLQMDGIIQNLKRHKTDKGIQEGLQGMHAAVAQRGPGMLKKAYVRGFRKAAEETFSEDSSEANPSDTNTDRSPEEAIIDQLRRGWPDPLIQARIDYEGPGKEDILKDHEGQALADRDSAESRNKINKHSPDITI